MNLPIPSLYGLSGNAGSGKDTVAYWLAQEQNLAVVALADPMKRFLRNVFGWDNEQLWGPSERRNEKKDDFDWPRAARCLTSHASGLIDEILPQTCPDCGGPGSSRKPREAIDEWFMILRDADIRVLRVHLQTLGTECGRAVDKDLWVHHLICHVLPQIRTGWHYEKEWGIVHPRFWIYDGATPVMGADLFAYAKHIDRLLDNPGYIPPVPASIRFEFDRPKAGVVVPDIRFENELRGVQESGGLVFRVRRSTEKPTGLPGHASEAEQKTIQDQEFDLVLNLPEGLEEAKKYALGLLSSTYWPGEDGR